jgi:hypothetical protein
MSKITSIQTKKKSSADTKIEVHLPTSLKTTTQKLAEINQSTLSKLIINYLHDLITNDISKQRILPKNKHIRRIQLTKIQRIHAEQLTLLKNLLTLTQQTNSPLTTTTYTNILKKISNTIRNSFQLLHHNIS